MGDKFTEFMDLGGEVMEHFDVKKAKKKFNKYGVLSPDTVEELKKSKVTRDIRQSPAEERPEMAKKLVANMVNHAFSEKGVKKLIADPLKKAAKEYQWQKEKHFYTPIRNKKYAMEVREEEARETAAKKKMIKKLKKIHKK